DGMGDFIAERITAQIPGGGRVLVLGLTFKENVPDLRNSKVIDVIRGLERRGFRTDVHDPHADADEAHHEYGVDMLTGPLDKALEGVSPKSGYDGEVAAGMHNDHANVTPKKLADLLRKAGLVADIKGLWGAKKFPAGTRYWTL